VPLNTITPVRSFAPPQLSDEADGLPQGQKPH
jgi:hypothetical protein